MSLEDRVRKAIEKEIQSIEWSMAGGGFWEDYGPNNQYRNYVVPIKDPSKSEPEIILPGDPEQEIYLPGWDEEDWYQEVEYHV